MKTMSSRRKRQFGKKLTTANQKIDKVYCKNYCCDGSGENISSVASAMRRVKIETTPYIMIG